MLGVDPQVERSEQRTRRNSRSRTASDTAAIDALPASGYGNGFGSSGGGSRSGSTSGQRASITTALKSFAGSLKRAGSGSFSSGGGGTVPLTAQQPRNSMATGAGGAPGGAGPYDIPSPTGSPRGVGTVTTRHRSSRVRDSSTFTNISIS
jgi:hypothetical protein